MGKIIIQNAKVYENGHFSEKELVIDGDPRQKELRLDGTGCCALPGFVDLHVHFRQPGFEAKETIATGSAAAAAGGYTTVCTMPNLDPVPHNRENLEKQWSVIKSDALIRVLPYASLTMDEKGGELSRFEELAPLAVGFSDDGKGLQSAEKMEEAMRRIRALGGLIAAHCEDNGLVNGGVIHQGKKAAAYGLPGISSESESVPVKRDLQLAAKTGVRYHICHISAAESVEAVRQAKASGLKTVSCEATPHQLALSEEDITENAGRFKMNPPLRALRDREAILRGLSDGTIDCIATDHAPHTAAEKSGTFLQAPFGVVGLETAFAVCCTSLVKSGIMDMAALTALMSLRPAEILGLSREETKNDWVLVNPDKRFTVDPGTFRSKGRSTPFEGRELTGTIEATIAKGRLVYSA